MADSTPPTDSTTASGFSSEELVAPVLEELTSSYRPRPTKRRRRTKAEIEDLSSIMVYLLSEEQPMTVRQLFYRMVSEGWIEKSEKEYKNTVVRLLGHLRRGGILPYAWIADMTRWMRKPQTFGSLEDALRLTAETYRRDLWAAQDAYVEVWLEKDALAGVVDDVTRFYDVPLMVTRGYPSLSFLHAAASALEDLLKPAFVYYFGDHDPSGRDISRNVEERLRELAPSAEIHFERIAVEPWQIEEWNLPTRPTKATDTRSKTFRGESVELDALPPNTLRALVKHAIEEHIDTAMLSMTERIEDEERDTLMKLAREGAA